VDNTKVLSATDTTFYKGMAGLITGSITGANNDALFDNLKIGPIGYRHWVPTVFSKEIRPIYKEFQK
jgi:hypothetical protein